MKINGKEVSREMMEKILHCETPENLMKLAKDQGVDLTKEQAEAILAEQDDIPPTNAQMKQAAGGNSNRPGRENWGCPGVLG